MLKIQRTYNPTVRFLNYLSNKKLLGCVIALYVCVCVFFFLGEGRAGGISTKKGKTLQSTSQLGICMFLFYFSNVNFFFFSKISDVAFLVAFQPKRGRHCKVLASQVYACFYFYFSHVNFFFFPKISDVAFLVAIIYLLLFQPPIYQHYNLLAT